MLNLDEYEYEYEDDYDDEEDEMTDDDAEIVLPELHPTQQIVYESKARFKVLLCGRRWGKTFVSHRLAIEAMLKGKKVAIVTPEFSLGGKFFKKLLSYLPQNVIRECNKSERVIELITDGSVYFFSGHAVDNIRGNAFHLVIIDEAAKLPNLMMAWGDVIRPALMDYKGSALIISTPRGRDFFYQLYLKGQRKEGGFRSWRFTSYDNTELPEGEVESIKETLTPDQIKQEILAEPLANVDGVLSEDVIEKYVINDLSIEPTVVYGIDLADSSDWTVVVGLDADGNMSYFDRFQKIGWPETTKRLKALPNGITKVMDNTGVGRPIVQELVASGILNIIGVDINKSSKAPLIQKLLIDIQNGVLRYNRITADELLSFERKYNSSGHTRFEAQAGAHDDCVMALALANKHHVSTRSISNWKLYTV